MEDQSNEIDDIDEQTLRNHQVTLLELLDRLIDKGVVVKGEVLLTVADVDLVYLNLALLLSSVKTVELAARDGDQNPRARRARKRTCAPDVVEEQPAVSSDTTSSSPAAETAPRPEHGKHPQSDGNARTSASGQHAATERVPSGEAGAQRRTGSGINIDPEHVEKGLVALVLTLVDLIRQLMEKQAIRRIENDQLTEAEIERVGNAFFLLDDKIKELKEQFELNDDDLNLNLGPLGDLL